MSRSTDDFRSRARRWTRGNRYEDFEIGRVFDHHWGRTLTEGDNVMFTTLTMHYNPLYFNAPYAVDHGHPRLVVNPLLAFNTVFGLTVEDLSEGGGPFLGVERLQFHQPLHIGDTVRAVSEVLDRRISEKFKGFGIVTWHTRGFNQDDICVLEFDRSNLVRLRDAA